MKLKDMSFDAVLHADSEYTICSVIRPRWRIEKQSKSAQTAENVTFGALGKTFINLEQKGLESSALRRSKENCFLFRMVTSKFVKGQYKLLFHHFENEK
jgi:hypothetical protein